MNNKEKKFYEGHKMNYELVMELFDSLMDLFDGFWIIFYLEPDKWKWVKAKAIR